MRGRSYLDELLHVMKVLVNMYLDGDFMISLGVRSRRAYLAQSLVGEHGLGQLESC